MTDVLEAKLDAVTEAVVKRAIAQRDKVGRPRPMKRCCSHCGGAHYRANCPER